MAVRCTGCDRVLETTADLDLGPDTERSLRIELIRAVGPVAAPRGLDAPLALEASTVNALALRCPGCGGRFTHSDRPPG